MILLNDFRRQWNDIGSDVLTAVSSVGESGWYILGERVARFETALADWWKVPYAVGVASGLDAIELSLRALGCRAGQCVLTSPVSAFATTLAILKIGAVPVFADVDDTGLIDLEACRRVLQSRPDIRFFVPVHLYGHCLDLVHLRALRDEFELNIVEDCAQSIGARSHNSPTGSVGQFAATSFYPTKNLGTLGDGGAVLCHRPEHVEAIRILRDYGQVSKYRHNLVGYNSRLDELHAAILESACLPRLTGWTQSRRDIADLYRNALSSRDFAVVPAPVASDSCWHLFPVLVNCGTKPEALRWLKARGVTAGEHYPVAVIDQHALEPIRQHIRFDCPRARAFCSREISLPIHPYLTGEEITTVIEACNRWRPGN